MMWLEIRRPNDPLGSEFSQPSGILPTPCEKCLSETSCNYPLLTNNPAIFPAPAWHNYCNADYLRAPFYLINLTAR